MPALPVKLLMAPRRSMLFPKVSPALQGDEQWLGLPQFGRDAVPSSHSQALISLVESSYPRLETFQFHSLSLVSYSLGSSGSSLLFWPVMPRCGFVLASKNFPGASSNFSPKSSVALVCSGFFSAPHPERQGSKCPLSLSSASGIFLRPFCAKGAQGEAGRTGAERGASIFWNSSETEKCRAPN